MKMPKSSDMSLEQILDELRMQDVGINCDNITLYNWLNLSRTQASPLQGNSSFAAHLLFLPGLLLISVSHLLAAIFYNLFLSAQSLGRAPAARF